MCIGLGHRDFNMMNIQILDSPNLYISTWICTLANIIFPCFAFSLALISTLLCFSLSTGMVSCSAWEVIRQSTEVTSGVINTLASLTNYITFLLTNNVSWLDHLVAFSLHFTLTSSSTHLSLRLLLSLGAMWSLHPFIRFRFSRLLASC